MAIFISFWSVYSREDMNLFNRSTYWAALHVDESCWLRKTQTKESFTQHDYTTFWRKKDFC